MGKVTIKYKNKSEINLWSVDAIDTCDIDYIDIEGEIYIVQQDIWEE
jgi:short subunit dehydrogenase-like uncharacterized protein